MQWMCWTKKLAVLVVLLAQVQVWAGKKRKVPEPPPRNPNVIQSDRFVPLLLNAQPGDWFIIDLDNTVFQHMFNLGADEGFDPWFKYYQTLTTDRNAIVGARALFVSVQGAFIKKWLEDPEFRAARQRMLELSEAELEEGFRHAVENEALLNGLTMRQPSYRRVTEPLITQVFELPFTDYYPERDHVKLPVGRAFVRPILAKGIAYSGEKTKTAVFDKGTVLLGIWKVMPEDAKSKIKRIFIIDDQYKHANAMLEAAEIIRAQTLGQIESVTAIEYLGCIEHAQKFKFDIAKDQLARWCPENLILESNEQIANRLRARQAAEDAKLQTQCDQVFGEETDRPVDPHLKDEIIHDIDRFKTGASFPTRRH